MKNKNYSLTSCITNSKASFTAKYNELVSSIIINCILFTTQKGELYDLRKIMVACLFDTGASQSYITKSTAFLIGLISEIDLLKNSEKGKVFVVMLQLPSGIRMPIDVTIVNDLPDAGFIIGMDVIGLGALSIDNSEGITKVGFELPTNQEILMVSYSSFADDPGIITKDSSGMAFTVNYNFMKNKIFFDCWLSEYSNHGEFKAIRAILDTGSPVSLVTGNLAKEMNLFSYGTDKLNDHVGIYDANVYIMDIKLPAGPVLTYPVAESRTISEEYSLLIGMDIIKNTICSLTNNEGRTAFSFELIESKN